MRETPSPLAALAYYFGACCLGVTVPLLSSLKNAAQWFGLGRMEYVTTLLALFIAPPLALFTADRIAVRWVPTLGRPLRLLTLLASLAAFTHQSTSSLHSHYIHVPLVLRAGIFLLAFVALGWAALKLERRVATYVRLLGMISPIALAWYGTFAARLHRPEPPRSTLSGMVTRGESAAGPPIVLVILDSFSLEAVLDDEGRLSDRFPNFNRLANLGFWLEDATTNYDTTLRSMPSMLSGKFLTNNADDTPPTLFRYLDGRYSVEVYGIAMGYCDALTAAKCANRRTFFRNDLAFRLHSVLVQYLVAALPQPLLYSIPFRPRHPDKEVSIRLADLALRSLTTSELHGRFIFIHVLIPHSPHELERSGQPGLPGPWHTFRDDLGPNAFEKALEWYRREIDWTDLFVGQILDAMDTRHLLDETLLIVTSDHGAKMDHPAGRQAGVIHTGIARVPLFIKPPAGRAGRSIQHEYQHVDLVPTIFDLLGFRTTDSLDGRSIFQPLEMPRPKRAFSLDSEWNLDPTSHEWRQINPSVAPR